MIELIVCLSRFDNKKVLNDVTRYVPFRLATPTGNSIFIDKPLTFDSIVDHLDVTHIKFEPNNASSMKKIVDTLLGDLSTGIETKEEMLLIGMPLTGVGRLERHSNGLWHLIPHERWGGILTQSSRSEVISEYNTRSNVKRFFCICFGIAAGCTAAYLLYRSYEKRRQRINRLPFVSPVAPTSVTEPSAVRVRCVICLENEVIYSLQPCSHIGLCHSCTQSLQSRGNEQELCPLCRTPIEQYQRVFLP
jgi:hypothetical protein